MINVLLNNALNGASLALGMGRLSKASGMTGLGEDIKI